MQQAAADEFIGVGRKEKNYIISNPSSPSLRASMLAS
jgi:hypothetical protein